TKWLCLEAPSIELVEGARAMRVLNADGEWVDPEEASPGRERAAGGAQAGKQAVGTGLLRRLARWFVWGGVLVAAGALARFLNGNEAWMVLCAFGAFLVIGATFAWMKDWGDSWSEAFSDREVVVFVGYGWVLLAVWVVCGWLLRTGAIPRGAIHVDN